MKKTIISIIGIAVMLLAITACQPRIVWVPGLGGNNDGQTTKEPVEVSTPEDMMSELQQGNPVKLTAPMEASDFAGIPDNSEIDGNNQEISVPTEGASPNGGAWVLPKGLKLSNAIIDVTTAEGASIQGRANDDVQPPFVVLINNDGVELTNVKFIMDASVAGINVYQADNVKLENLEFEGAMAKAPINITDSTVTLAGSYTKGTDYNSGWYEDSFVVQVNGQDGDVNEASTVTFSNATGIDAVWQEEVIADGAEHNPAIVGTPAADGQSQIKGLGDGYTYIFSITSTAKGWMWAPKESAASLLLPFFENPAHERFFNRLNGFEDPTMVVTKPTDIRDEISYSLELNGYSYNSGKTATATGSLTASFTGTASDDNKLNADKWILDGDNIELSYTSGNVTSVIVVSFDEFSGIISTSALGTEQKTAVFSESDGNVKVENPDEAKFSFAGELSGSVTINGVVFTASDISAMLGASGN